MCRSGRNPLLSECTATRARLYLPPRLPPMRPRPPPDVAGAPAHSVHRHRSHRSRWRQGVDVGHRRHRQRLNGKGAGKMPSVTIIAHRKSGLGDCRQADRDRRNGISSSTQSRPSPDGRIAGHPSPRGEGRRYSRIKLHFGCSAHTRRPLR